MGNREWGVGTRCASPHSPLPIPYSLFCFFLSANESVKLGAEGKAGINDFAKALPKWRSTPQSIKYVI